MEQKGMKLCLGTAQLGMQYGVKNELHRQPTEKEAFAILDAAIQSGIEIFDTAKIYGTAEDLLGRYGIEEKKVRIVSKLPPGTLNQSESVLKEAIHSLDRLRMKKFYCYMLHQASDLNREGIMDGLCTVKKTGLTDKIGVSIYEPEEAMQAVQDQRIDAIQIPYNVLDQRLDRCHFFACAKKNHKEIFARSAFLQGLLLMSPMEAEQKVRGSGAYVGCFQEIADEHHLSPSEAAMLFSIVHPQIDYTVFGVDTAKQLIDNLKIGEKISHFSMCYDKLRSMFQDVPKEIIVPSLW